MDSLWQDLNNFDLEALARNEILANVFGVVVLLFVGWVVLGIARRWVVGGIERLIAHTETQWDDALRDSGVFSRLAPLAPALVAWYGAELIPHLHDSVGTIVRRMSAAVMIVVVVRCITAFFNATNEIYLKNPGNRHRPIKGYLQVALIIIHLIAGILILATMMDKSPWLFLSGLGALTAVLLLIFRDTLLSLVASILITSNDMVHVGDWIEMPQFGADGDVVDIALHTVKVQNWDKTITSIPTYQLISSSFKNWRGMSLSGGRRIKRSIYLDIASVRFLTAEEVDRFERFDLLRDYIRDKRTAVARHNENAADPAIQANVRQLTNIGTFRAYIEAYLRQNEQIHPHMTLLVRQLAPAPEGLPIEIYCFTRDTAWGRYEAIQADIFDHMFAILPEFGLRAFQWPAGHDVKPPAG